MEELEAKIEGLKDDIEELETELRKKESELSEKENAILPYKVKVCKYRKGNYCSHFKGPTSDNDCSDCINTYDIWEKR
jgi:chromosome segregation ATPase